MMISKLLKNEIGNHEDHILDCARILDYGITKLYENKYEKQIKKFKDKHHFYESPTHSDLRQLAEDLSKLEDEVCSAAREDEYQRSLESEYRKKKSSKPKKRIIKKKSCGCK